MAWRRDARGDFDTISISHGAVQSQSSLDHNINKAHAPPRPTVLKYPLVKPNLYGNAEDGGMEREEGWGTRREER